jgi:hypothetical protein
VTGDGDERERFVLNINIVIIYFVEIIIFLICELPYLNFFLIIITTSFFSTFCTGGSETRPYARTIYTANGIRTRVFAVRGRCPWPLDYSG